MERSQRPRRVLPPIDQARLEDMALRYVGKYATTRAKLSAYLHRKLRERGWAGEKAADVAALAERFASLGYVDDAAYAMGQSRSLAARGYGKRRLSNTLRVAGVADADAGDARRHADAEAVRAALRLAQRRRLGPFASAEAERPQREKWIAAMIRGGHGFALARAIASMSPGAEIDEDQLSEFVQLTDA